MGKSRALSCPGICSASWLPNTWRADARQLPISANDAVERRLGERNVLLEKTKIGSPYVISALDELRGAGKFQRVAGWEANGGFLTGSDIGSAKPRWRRYRRAMRYCRF